MVALHAKRASSSLSALDLIRRSSSETRVNAVLVAPGDPIGQAALEDGLGGPAKPDGSPLALQRAPEPLHEGNRLAGAHRAVPPADAVPLEVLLHPLRGELRALVSDEVTRGAVPGDGVAEEADRPDGGRLAFGDADGEDLAAEGVDDGADVESEEAEKPGELGEVGEPDVVRVARPDALRWRADGLYEGQGPAWRQAAELAPRRERPVNKSRGG